MSSLSIPTWQQQALAQLSAEGLLSGVSPVYLAVIDQAESSGQGGGLNSAGYGGFFGLGAGSTYPAGPSSATLLTDPSAQSFDEQAILAASSFASDLSQAGGNPIAAEGIYQTGSATPSGGPSEGQTLMSDILGGPAAGGAPSTSLTSGMSFLGPIGGSIVGGATSSIVASLGRILLYVAFVAGGIVLVILGLQRLTGGKVPIPVPVPV